MHFALVANNRVEASPNLKGLCPCCSQPVNAKCGSQKIWHWAHRSKTNCDNWWEPETEWHRNWKNNYPAGWQEISLTDCRTREKHITDVRTEHNLVIEFQHSHIEPQERTAREKFYKSMVWVVDGTRLKRDSTLFFKEWNSYGISAVRKTDKPGIFEVLFPEFCFPPAWLKSSVPVIFDFQDDSMDDSKGKCNILYCLFPQFGRKARVAEISRKAFTETTKNGEWSSRVQNFIDNFKKQDAIEQQKEQQNQSRSVGLKWRGVPKEWINKYQLKRQIAASLRRG